jgi:hypothetical protein
MAAKHWQNPTSSHTYFPRRIGHLVLCSFVRCRGSSGGVIAGPQPTENLGVLVRQKDRQTNHMHGTEEGLGSPLGMARTTPRLSDQRTGLCQTRDGRNRVSGTCVFPCLPKHFGKLLWAHQVQHIVKPVRQSKVPAFCRLYLRGSEPQ